MGNSKFYDSLIKHKGRLQRKEENFEARTICTSYTHDRPINFFLAAGFEIEKEKKREIMEGAYEGITFYGYFDEVPYIEACLVCQLSEIEDAIEKLNDFERTL